MAGVNYEPLEIQEIKRLQYKDIKYALIHQYDIYNVIEKSLKYSDNIIIE